MVVVFWLGGITAAFNDFLSERLYSAAKLTAVALACSASGSGLNLGMPTVCDVVSAGSIGSFSFPNHNSSPVSTLPTTKKYEKIGIRNLLPPSGETTQCKEWRSFKKLESRVAAGGTC